jgi:hypothetical protein
MFGLWMAISPAMFVDDIIDKRYLQLTLMLRDTHAKGYGLKELGAVERLHILTCRNVFALFVLFCAALLLIVMCLFTGSKCCVCTKCTINASGQL